MLPKFYNVNIVCNTTVGSQARGSVTLDNEAFELVQITHQILDADDNDLFQDGGYTVSLRDDVKTFISRPVAADLVFGSIRTGNQPKLVCPIPSKGNKTYHFEITNLVDRQAHGQTFQVQFALIGIATDQMPTL